MKGFVTIATGQEKYFKLAKNLLDSYRYFAKEKMPFAIITDKENEYTAAFDKVVLLEKAHCSYLDKIELLKSCPFEENIFIDADCLAYGDLNTYWKSFENASDFSCFGEALPLDAEDGWFSKDGAGKYKDQIDYVVHLHGVMYYIKKGEKCEEMYQLCQEIIQDYDNYTFSQFNDSPADESTFALAMAVCKCKPVKREKQFYIFLPYATEVDADIACQKLNFSNPKDGNVENGLLIHYGNINTQKALYKFEIEQLKKLVQGQEITQQWKKKTKNEYIRIEKKEDRKVQREYYKGILMRKLGKKDS